MSSYQWQRGDSSGASLADIPGATSPGYQRVAADAGHSNVVKVTTGGVTVASPAYGVTQTGGATPYVDINFEGPFPPTGWQPSTFQFSSTPTNASYAIVADPLGVEGNVLRLRCPANSSLTTDYTSPSLQQAALGVTNDSYAHAQLSDETWYRYRVMFPAGNVFCSGFSNYLIEWHVNDAQPGPWSPGMFAFGGYPLLSGGTTSAKFIFVMRSGSSIANVTEKFYPGGTSDVNTASGIPIVTNHWYDIVFHIKWQTDASGLFEWWVDGSKIVSAAGPTYYATVGESLGNAVYNYRYNVTGDSNIYWGRIMSGPTMSALGVSLP